jgi:hypothetical protein
LDRFLHIPMDIDGFCFIAIQHIPESPRVPELADNTLRNNSVSSSTRTKKACS